MNCPITDKAFNEYKSSEELALIAAAFENALRDIAKLDDLHLGWGPVIAKQTLEKVAQ